jgi:hypothetical protein
MPAPAPGPEPVIHGISIAPMGRRVTQVLASSIEQPVAGGTAAGSALAVRGWAIGKDAPVEAVEAVADNRIVARTPVGRPTPVLAERFGAAGAWAATAGFAFDLETLGLDPAFEVRLRAVIGGLPVARLAIVRGQRRPLRPDYAPRLHPLLVTSIGRTGSTLLMRLLAAHPAIVAYRRLPYEVRAAKYWLHGLLTLASSPDPAKRIGQPNEFHLERVVAGNPFATADFAAYPEAAAWARSGYLDDLAGFVLKAIDGWYGAVATAQGQPSPVFWVEKTFPDQYATLARELDPQGRELVLVRDFRDMWTSMRAYNERRGFGDFGQARAKSDELWLEELRLGAGQLLETLRRAGGRAKLVRYEDLVADPAAALGPILGHLGLDAAPAVVAAMVANAAEDLPDLRAHQTSANAAASLGRWRRDLSPEQQEQARAAFDDLLPHFGYPAGE